MNRKEKCVGVLAVLCWVTGLTALSHGACRFPDVGYYPIYVALPLAVPPTTELPAESAWSSASLGWGLVEEFDPCVLADEPTAFRFLWDTHALYARFYAARDPEAEDGILPIDMNNPQTRRWDWWDLDRGSQHDRKLGLAPADDRVELWIEVGECLFKLTLNREGIVSFAVNTGQDFVDEPVALAVQVQDASFGWVTTIRLPWTVLRTRPPCDGEAWAVNIHRDRRRMHNWAFMGWMRNMAKIRKHDYDVMDRAGTLLFRRAFPDDDQALWKQVLVVAKDRGCCRIYLPKRYVDADERGAFTSTIYTERATQLAALSSPEWPAYLDCHRMRVTCGDDIAVAFAAPWVGLLQEREEARHVASALKTPALLETPGLLSPPSGNGCACHFGWREDSAYHATLDTTRADTTQTQWARPLPGGPIRVFLLTIEQGGGNAREFAARLDGHVLGFMADAWYRLGSVYWLSLVAADSAKGEREALLLRAFQAHTDLDVIVLGEIRWGALTSRLQLEVLRRVYQGTGLIFAHRIDVPDALLANEDPDASALLAAGMPWQGLDYYAQDFAQQHGVRRTTAIADRLIRAAHFGKGRVIALDYRPVTEKRGDHGGLLPPLEYTPEADVQYDFHQALLLRAVRWASGREETLRWTEPLPDGTRIARAQLPKVLPLRAQWALDTFREVTVTARIRNALNAILAVQTHNERAAPGATILRVTLPHLPRGKHYVDVMARSAQGVEGWGAFTVEIADTVQIVSVALPEMPVWRGERLTGTLRLAGVDGSMKAVLSLFDDAGRLLDKQEISLHQDQSEAAFVLDTSTAISPYLRVTAALLHEGETVDTRQVETFLRLPPPAFGAVVWGILGTYPGQRTNRLLREAGFTHSLNWPPEYLEPHTDPYNLARAGMLWSVYFGRIFRGNIGGGYGEANTCEETRRAARDRANRLCRAAPALWSLGDENELPSAPDTRDFVHCLRQQYESLSAVSDAFQTTFSSWDDVRPFDRDKQPLHPGDYAWFHATQAAREWIYARAHELKCEGIRQAVPDAIVGAEGSPLGNPEWTLANLNFWGPYWEERDNLLTQAVGCTGIHRGNWFGGYVMYRNRDTQGRNVLWRTVLDGSNLLMYFCITGIEGFFAADQLTPAQHTERWWETWTEIVDNGLGQWFAGAEPTGRPVVLLYDQTSEHMGTVAPPGWQVAPAHAAFLSLLGDAGHSARILTSGQVAAGALRDPDIRALCLIHAFALPDEILPELSHFVERGGLVLADVAPGLFDGLGRRRTAWPLRTLFGRPNDDPPDTLAYLEHIHPATPESVRSVRPGTILLNGILSTRPSLRPTATDVLRSALGKADVAPNYQAGLAAGQVGWGCRKAAFRRGQVEMFAYLPPENVTETGNVGCWMRFPAAAQTYLVRSGTYLGDVDHVEATVQSATPLLVARLPYRVVDLLLEIDGAVVRATLRTEPPTPAAGHILRLDAWQPDGSPSPYRRLFAECLSGSASWTVPIAQNDPAGEWELVVRDCVTGIQSRAAMVVTPAPHRQ